VAHAQRFELQWVALGVVEHATFPGRYELATSNTDLATSTAIVVCCMRIAPSDLRWSLASK
jgi:hypothetical protein